MELEPVCCAELDSGRSDRENVGSNGSLPSRSCADMTPPFSWPFYPNASSYCLDTGHPIDGDQNLPAFPTYANNVSNIKIDTVVGKKNVSSLVGSANNSPALNATASGTSAASTVNPAATPGPTKASSALRRLPNGMSGLAAVGSTLLLGCLLLL